MQLIITPFTIIATVGLVVVASLAISLVLVFASFLWNFLEGALAIVWFLFWLCLFTIAIGGGISGVWYLCQLMSR